MWYINKQIRKIIIILSAIIVIVHSFEKIGFIL